tara:strand:- start:590 stop:1435 length:846 start_codon:yes stop_codon:yes gene_type:complete
MSIVHKSTTLLFSSNPANGAQNVSADGSSFDVVLATPLMIHPSAVSCTLSVIQANIWNVSPNISPKFNNNIFNFTTSNSANPGTYNIVFPEGLYSIANFGGYISNFLTNQGLPADLITVSADDSTSQSVITFLDAGDSVNFTVTNSCREVLGFDSRIAPTSGQIAGWSEYSDRQAEFNRVNSFLITSNIVSGGLPINTGGRNVIGSVPINVKTGSQINYDPQNSIEIEAIELSGNSKLNVSFQLRDQLLRLAPTAGEYWSIIVRISYGILLSDDKMPMIRF